MKAARIVIAILIAVAGCGGGGSGGGPSPSLALSKPALSGDAQSGEVGHGLTLPLKVLVKLDTVPAAGKTITWAAGAGSGSVAPGTSVTGADGIATAVWTLGATPGPETATASIGGAAGSPLGYTATALAPVLALPLSSGNAQSDTVHAFLAESLRVAVTLGGVPLVGRTVTWATSNAGGLINPTSSITGAGGIATTTWRLGTVAGNQAATATTLGAAAAQAYSASAAAGVAASLAANGGDAQTADTGAAFAALLSVVAKDQFGNGRAGAPVTWAVTSANATVTPAVDTTNIAGLASVTLHAGGAVGAVTVTATSPGLNGSPVSFGATISHVPMVFTVTVGNDFFSSDSITISAGDQVKWVWAASAVTHNVTSDGSPAFTSSVNLGANQTYGPILFSAPGIYYYYCSIHGSHRSGMYGVIVVQ
ncbi:MAG: plastocyanin/azurin family copper-binding protein [Gemmatimonadales bacterium]